jgi:hypothetical protein
VTGRLAERDAPPPPLLLNPFPLPPLPHLPPFRPQVGQAEVRCEYSDVSSAEPCPPPLVMAVTVTPVDVPPRLKAILQYCQVCFGDGGFSSARI